MVSQFPFGQDFVVLRDAMNQLLKKASSPRVDPLELRR